MKMIMAHRAAASLTIIVTLYSFTVYSFPKQHTLGIVKRYNCHSISPRKNCNFISLVSNDVSPSSNNLVMKLSSRSSVDSKPSPKLQMFLISALSMLASIFLPLSVSDMNLKVQSAQAADTVAVGTCLLKSCQKELAQCLLNPKCLANLVCINTCNGRSDEAPCQIKCGDLFENDVVGVFNSCAVSQKRCVPQKQDEGEYPLPASSSMVKAFDASIWNGRWYISAGLNKIFDTFDCQVHFFTSPSPGKFYAKIFWRITEPDGEFFTKDTVQRFVQDPKNPAHFLNHDNEYLHYKDDWYIIDYDPKEFVLVYYKGSNDAWDGYGGAFLYTRSPSVKPELIPRLEKAVESMGLRFRWSDFVLTDNTCTKQTESPTVLREKFATRLLITEEKQLQEQLTAVRSAAVNSLVMEEKEAEKSIQVLEKELQLFQQEAADDVRKLEKVVESEIISVEKALLGTSGGGKK